MLKSLFGARAPFASKFGGLWIDRTDGPEELARRRDTGGITPRLADDIAAFMANGYVILQQAVPPSLIDRLAARISRAYREGDAVLRYQTDGAADFEMAAGTEPRGTRIVESHAQLPEVRDVLAADRILAFLAAIFEQQPVLTQSLIFQTGSEQPLHQDPVFVAYNKPLCMAAAWVALEDVQPGSGELRYVPGSHRLEPYVFASGRLDHHKGRPGELAAYNAWLAAQIANLAPETFLPKKGDVLIWHAGLAHGGSPITNPAATRQSLVGHYCPQAVFPAHRSGRMRLWDGRLMWSNHLYRL